MDKGFPIDLMVETTGQLAELTWTPTNISTFEEYLAVRSENPIPPSISPNANFIVTRIDDFTEASFSDAGLSFEEELHYKVYNDLIAFLNTFTDSELIVDPKFSDPFVR